MADLTTIEYRVLAVEAGAYFGDHVVVGLVHSDGSQIRHAFHVDQLPATLASAEPAVLGAIRTFERKLANEKESLLVRGGLDAVVGFREGAGASLVWSPPAYARTGNAAAHFADLVREHALSEEERDESLRVSAEELRAGLRELGERLMAKYPGSIRIGASTDSELPFTAPLAWKTTVWHHAVPVALDSRKPGEVSRRMLEVFGPAVVGVPANDVAVLVTVMPEANEARVALENGRRAIAKHRGNDTVELVEAGRDEERRFETLMALIERQVSAARAA